MINSKAADRARLKRSDVRKRLAAGTRRGRERRPNAADMAAPPATQAASTRALAAPSPVPSLGQFRFAADESTVWVVRIITGASKRVSRCARGACGAVGEKRVARLSGGVGSTLSVARGTRSPM
jgi:hypothetical protein